MSRPVTFGPLAVIVLAPLAVLGALLIAQRPAYTGAGLEPLLCNGPAVRFESGVPQDWAVVDNAGTGIVWSSVAGSGEAANYTGGEGDAASVSSDKFNETYGQTEFDTELRTNELSIGEYSSAALQYLVNYQHLTDTLFERDLLDLDISTNGGQQWTTLLSWDEDHGTLREPIGEAVTVDLTQYIGLSGLMLRWHYYDPLTGDNDWYAQVDEVELACWLTVRHGDVDCDGAVNAVDALKILRHAAALPVSRDTPCIDIGTPVTAGLAATAFGDLDCSGVADTIDALKTLRFAAGLLITQLTPCISPGASIDLYY